MQYVYLILLEAALYPKVKRDVKSYITPITGFEGVKVS
jgi:hypothetical protein